MANYLEVEEARDEVDRSQAALPARRRGTVRALSRGFRGSGAPPAPAGDRRRLPGRLPGRSEGGGPGGAGRPRAEDRPRPVGVRPRGGRSRPRPARLPDAPAAAFRRLPGRIRQRAALHAPRRRRLGARPPAGLALPFPRPFRSPPALDDAGRLRLPRGLLPLAAHGRAAVASAAALRLPPAAVWRRGGAPSLAGAPGPGRAAGPGRRPLPREPARRPGGGGRP